MNRLWAFAGRHLLRRSLPHGLLSWRYLKPHPEPRVALHRRLWMMGRHPRLPMPLFLLGEGILWLRWVLFAAWRQSWRALGIRGKEIQEREGIPKSAQLARLLALSLGHGMPPMEVYAFGLHRPDAAGRIWDFVFQHEAQAFHRLRNGMDADPELLESLAILRDKPRLADLLAAQGIPMVPTLALIPRESAFDPVPHLQAFPRLFCKPRHGSASRDAFVLERGDLESQPAIFEVESGMKASASTWTRLREALAKDDLLVQPLMPNHQALAPLSDGNDAITLRIITERHASGVRCHCATLEIPIPAERCHAILPIAPASGLVERFPEERLPLKSVARHEGVHAHLGGSPLPHWNEALGGVLAAHLQIPQVRAIAWDCIIGPDGPRLLEGNSGWATVVPQVLLGGFLCSPASER